MNSTLEKFGYPNTLIKAYEHWSVLLRPQQITLGSLILGSNSEALAFGDLNASAGAELTKITSDLELSLTRCFNYDKINYLMLMMVDPHVHFHVIPRYQQKQQFDSIIVTDSGWPGPPNLIEPADFNSKQIEKLTVLIREQWHV